jgi:salicylate hydroxylase
MIAVSGGGIAGLAAGLAVLRNKIPLLFVAGSAPAKALLGGIQIAPNGWEALDRLGIADLARTKSTSLDAINVRDMRSTATLASLNLRESAYSSIARASLIRLLEAEITTIGGAKRIAANITHAVQRGPDQNWDLHIVNDDGSAYQVDALIAADGIRGFGRSYVNSLKSNETKQNIGGRIAMRAVARAIDLPHSFAQPFCNLWLGSGAHLVHYPINCGKDVNLVLTLDSAKVTDGWQQKYLGHNDMLATVCNNDNIKWTTTVLPNQTYQNCWRRGRTVLAGDAAHPIPPNLAQGAGQSLIDAASLMRWLGSSNIDDALSSYTQERAKAVSKIFKKATISRKIMALDGSQAKARNMVMGLGGTQMLNKWLAEIWAAA